MVSEKITLIIPFFNDSSYLVFWEQLIKETDIKNYVEIIIVDDHSDLTNYQILVSKFSESCVIIRNKENVGPWATRMVGVSLVKTKYFMFADADDELDINKIINFLNQDSFKKCLDIYSFGFIKLYLDGKTKIVDYPDNFELSGKSLIIYFNRNHPSKSLIARFYKVDSIRPHFIEITREAKKLRVAEDLFAITYLLSKDLTWDFRNEIIYKNIKRDDSITTYDFQFKEINVITNDAILSLIKLLNSSDVENKAVYDHLSQMLWEKKSLHSHPGFIKTLLLMVVSNNQLFFSLKSWLMLVKSIYLRLKTIFTNLYFSGFLSL